MAVLQLDPVLINIVGRFTIKNRKKTLLIEKNN
jgi:hypothetical protein